MKILFYIYSLNKGGAERVLLTLAEKFASCDNEVVVLTDTCDKREYTLPSSLQRYSVSDFWGKGLVSKIPRINRINALRRGIRELAPDRIVAFMLPGAVRAVKAAKKLGIPVISCVRYDPHSTYKGWKKWKLLYDIKNSYKIVCQNDYQKSFFKGKLQDKCEVIFNPISDSFMIEPYVGERRKVIVSTGRLVDFKRFDILMSAFMKIADKYPEYSLIIYGEGPYRDILERHIDFLADEFNDAKARISLPGDRSDVAEAIKDAPLYVLSSEGEGMPNSLMEAMALGLPVVATDCAGGGPASLIKDGVNGYLVPINDVDRMAEAIEKMLSDDGMRLKMGQEALNIRKKCNIDSIFEQWKQVIC